jgi:hypothetical protein
MVTSLNSWDAFFDALQKQKSEPVRRGYIRWVFTDDGAKSFSTDEKQQIAAQLLMAKRK